MGSLNSGASNQVPFTFLHQLLCQPVADVCVLIYHPFDINISLYIVVDNFIYFVWWFWKQKCICTFYIYTDVLKFDSRRAIVKALIFFILKNNCTSVLEFGIWGWRGGGKGGYKHQAQPKMWFDLPPPTPKSYHVTLDVLFHKQNWSNLKYFKTTVSSACDHFHFVLWNSPSLFNLVFNISPISKITPFFQCHLAFLLKLGVTLDANFHFTFPYIFFPVSQHVRFGYTSYS